MTEGTKYIANCIDIQSKNWSQSHHSSKLTHTSCRIVWRAVEHAAGVRQLRGKCDYDTTRKTFSMHGNLMAQIGSMKQRLAPRRSRRTGTIRVLNMSENCMVATKSRWMIQKALTTRPPGSGSKVFLLRGRKKALLQSDFRRSLGCGQDFTLQNFANGYLKVVDASISALELMVELA